MNKEITKALNECTAAADAYRKELIRIYGNNWKTFYSVDVHDDSQLQEAYLTLKEKRAAFNSLWG